MERRELLKLIAVLTGASFIGGQSLLTGCQPADTGAAITFTGSDLSFLNEVGETILPATATPGAKAANVSSTMQTIVTSCYNPAERSVFATSRRQLDEASHKKFNSTFLKATPQQREELLKEIDQEARTWQKNKKKGEPNHYFTMLKQLTLLGYFTSEVGCKQAMRYVPVPQRYDGNLPYKKGDKAYV
ncbi:MAG: gluconate 2-dehydrogenase subunit 3 family protein [Chitinophagaceae bacterium]